MYLSRAGWRLRNVRANVLWLLLTPLPFLLYLAWMEQATGDWLAPLNAQQPFFRGFAWPWITLFAPISPHALITPLEQFFVTLFLVVAFIACWRLPSAAYGLLGIRTDPTFSFYGDIDLFATLYLGGGARLYCAGTMGQQYHSSIVFSRLSFLRFKLC